MTRSMTTVPGRDVGGLAERADALRRLHTRGRPLVLPTVWDAASARLVVKAGFPIVATSSGAIVATLAYEDKDSMPVEKAFGVIARITRSVSAPVTADVEAGYRLSPKDLVERFLEAGAVGCNLEDTDHHSGAGVVDTGENADRLRAVRHAATKAGVEIGVAHYPPSSSSCWRQPRSTDPRSTTSCLGPNRGGVSLVIVDRGRLRRLRRPPRKPRRHPLDKELIG
jgi:Phosphoenolpyruvate phosphomutase